MTKAAILIGALLLFAGVAAASSLTSTGGRDTPTIDVPTLSTPAGGRARQEDRQTEDVSGPCDEAEHASDRRCTGTVGAVDDQRGDDDHHNSGPGNAEDNSGHRDDGNSGRGGGDDD